MVFQASCPVIPINLRFLPSRSFKYLADNVWTFRTQKKTPNSWRDSRMVLDYTGASLESGYIRDWQEYLKDEKDKDVHWNENFGEPISRGHSIWDKYNEVAAAHDAEFVGLMTRDMENLLFFSTLFSAVVTTCLIQFEQDIKGSAYDPGAFTANTLHTIVTRQLNVFLQALNVPPVTIEPLQDPGTHSSAIAIALWYISLDCALLVAGGAVCVKQWILQYEKANKLQYLVPYDRAIQHQQRHRNLRKWHVQGFGDLLGSIMLLDLIPFLAGSIYHYDISNTSLPLFDDLSSGFLGLYTSFLAFVIIAGVFIPTSPFKTSISNIIQSIPGRLQNNFRRGVAVKTILALSFMVAVITIPVAWTKTTIPIYLMILLWLSTTILCVVLGLRNGLKMGRVSHFVPPMSIGITVLMAASLAFVNSHSSMASVFTLVIACLSRRFSNGGSERRLPVNSLLLGSAGLAVGQFIAWHYTLRNYILSDSASKDAAQETYWATPLASVIVWASTTMLGVAFLIPEDEVEEDTREAEALGWLITHTSDRQIIYDALLCLPGIANTPLRRAELLESTRDILASFINSLIHPPPQRCLLANGTGRDGLGMDGVRKADHEIKLMLVRGASNVGKRFGTKCWLKSINGGFTAFGIALRPLSPMTL
ncbi:hypothetical protein FRC02_004120 [Tulasnella sp. 418]|nr:hypothetical protein FRC02_004120 [Tulasnella sp. 418]